MNVGIQQPLDRTSQILPSFPTVMNSIEAAWNASKNGEDPGDHGEFYSSVLPPLYNFQYHDCPHCKDDFSVSSKSTFVPQHGEGRTKFGLKKRVTIPEDTRNVSNSGENRSRPKRTLEISTDDRSPKSPCLSPNPDCEKYWNVVLNSMPDAVQPKEDIKNVVKSQSQRKGHESKRPVKDQPPNGKERQEQRPFKCSICSKSFRKRCNLLTHVSNVHEKLKPYYCPICLRHFARKSNCGKHVS